MSKSCVLIAVFKNNKKTVIGGYHSATGDYLDYSYKDALNLINRFDLMHKVKYYRVYAHDMELGVFYKTERKFTNYASAVGFFHEVMRQFKLT